MNKCLYTVASSWTFLLTINSCIQNFKCSGLFVLYSILILFLYQVSTDAVCVSRVFKCFRLFIYTIIVLLTRFPDIKIEFTIMSML